MSSLSLQPSYATAEAAIGAINTIQANEGFVTVKSGGGYSRRTGLRNFYYIQCQHSGSYRPSTSNSNIYKTSSRKSQCPFKAQVRLNPHDNTWVPVIKDSQHNHEPVLSPLDSSILRLRSQQNYGLEKIQSRVKTLSQMKTLTAKQIAARIMSECPNVYIIDRRCFSCNVNYVPQIVTRGHQHKIQRQTSLLQNLRHKPRREHQHQLLATHQHLPPQIAVASGSGVAAGNDTPWPASSRGLQSWNSLLVLLRREWRPSRMPS